MKRAYRAKTKKMRTAVKTTALMSLGIPFGSMPAIAQDYEGELAPIVITGSNIPTVELEVPSPVVTIDREEIDRSGAETVGELLRRLPQNNSGSFDEKFQSSFAPGTSGVSLRGLGMGYTLILVDGRRIADASMAQNTTTQFGNLNGIPMAVINRVEVLLDGASAIYGSDAVAGVINMITKDNFDGVQIDAGYSNSTHTDVATQSYSITGGTSSEQGSAWVNIDYFKRNSAQMDDRPFSASANQGPNGGYDFRSSAGNPGSIKILPGSENGFESGFYKVPTNSSGATTAEEIIANPGINRYDYNPWTTLSPEIERYGAAGNIKYYLTDYATAFVNTYYRKSNIFQKMAPTPAFGDINTGTYGILPAENAHNPFSEDITFRHRLIEVGPRLSDISFDNFRVTPGVSFDIGENWKAETAFMFNSDASLSVGSNYVSADAFKTALSSSDPSTAYNIFGAGLGVNSPEILDALRVNTVRNSMSERQMWDVKAWGTIAELPGGPLGMAIGVESVQASSSDIGDSLSMANKIIGSGGSSNSGDRSRTAEFVELAIPVIGEDNRITGIHTLGLQAAWRFEQYSDFSNTDNPKFGIKYAPTERLLFRSTYQKAFKAPSLYHLYMGNTISYPTLRDPARGDEGMQYKTRSGGNPGLTPEESDNISAGVSYDVPMPENITLSLGVGYFKYDLEDQIASIGAQYMLNNEDRFKYKINRNPQTDADKAATNHGPDCRFGTEDNPEWGEDDTVGGGIPGSINYIDNFYANIAEVQVEG